MGRWTVNVLRNLELKKYFLDVKSQFYLIWEIYDIYRPTANNPAVKTRA
jgi:hypothetical protein